MPSRSGPITRRRTSAAALAILILTASTVRAQANAWGTGAGNTGAGRYADANGIRLYYEIHGTGTPLILRTADWARSKCSIPTSLPWPRDGR